MQACSLWPAQLAHCRRHGVGASLRAALPLAAAPLVRSRGASVCSSLALRRQGRRSTRVAAQLPPGWGAPGGGSGGDEQQPPAAPGAPPLAPAAGGEKQPQQQQEEEEEQEAILITAADVAAALKEDVRADLRTLAAAAAGRFDGGAVSVADRVRELASGAFLRGDGSGRQGRQQQRGGAGSASPLSQGAAAGEAGQQQQEQQATGGRLEVVEATVLEEGGAGPLPKGWGAVGGGAAAAGAGASVSAAASSAEEEGEVGEEEDGAAPPRGGEWLPVSGMAAFVTLCVAAAQWWPVLPDAWWGLTSGHAAEALWQMATMYPDTPVTRALQMDVRGVVLDGEWARLVTTGLLHSGLLPALAAADGLRNAGVWVEAVCGGLQAGVILACAALGAGAAQLLAPVAGYGLGGAGLAVGAYAAWAVIAATRARGLVPYCSDRGLIYIVLFIALAAQRPAVGLPCLLGGAAGGAVGALLARPLAAAAFAGVALPVTLTLAAVRAAIETAKLIAGIAAALALATWRAAAEAVRAVRGL